ncbi:MAG TPA: xanthine dehydrogenase family protein molybdopterin-binding subunit [Myxococcaceae bacterium]|nr:xanthine dehydrogenase family protein molybdopterin-binding subunit [Myxococcaceae bacterium]
MSGADPGAGADAIGGIGHRARRHEDARLLRGLGRFADDVNRAGQLYARVLRSPVAHARIAAIDAKGAAAPGVLAVVLGADLAGVPPIPIRLPRGDEPPGRLQPVLARDEVRYVGEPVAVVVAEDAYLAEDAAERIEITYQELPVTLDFTRADPAVSLEVGYGDVAEAFHRARWVVEIDVAVGRHAAVPLEPRGLVAEYDAGTDRLEVWGATKVPVFNRNVLARMLNMPESRIHLHAMDAGGGFGGRGEFYPEDLLIPWLARRLRRPVKWTEDRAENLVALNHSRQQRHRIAAAFDPEGRLLALKDHIAHDNGAYLRTHGLAVPELTITMLPGPYRVPAFHARIDVVLTHKTPCGTYRAPGRYEGTFAREHLFDVAADRIGVDRAELRRRNLLTPGEMPHRRNLNALGTDVVLDGGDYPALLESALRVSAPWRDEADRLRRAGHRAGYGFAFFVEKSGLGPHETAEVIVDRDGLVRVHSGGTSLGQGVQTVLAQIAADCLRVPDTSVTVVTGDTDLAPFGVGSWASRTTVVAGSAVHLAARSVLERARVIASRMLEASAEDLCVAGGRLHVRGVPTRSVTLGEVAAACAPGSRYLAPDEAPGLAARRRFEVDHMTYPYGVHLALVDVDSGTGRIDVLRYLVAYEIGRAINPTLVEGQLVGGAAQGLGGALYEEFRYDQSGQPLATTFMDYLMPTAAEVAPRVDTVVTEDAPSPSNPLGMKGAGEGGIAGVGAALANAVRDALGLPGEVGSLPLHPERVTELLASSRASQSG